MEMVAQYSVAICPGGKTQQAVRALKKVVFDTFGNFGSIHAEAHITLNTFKSSASKLAIWEGNLHRFCEEAVPFEVSFNHTSSFVSSDTKPVNTFFVAPDTLSKVQLTNLMKEFHRKAPALPGVKKVYNPHITVARGIEARRLSTMEQMFAGKELGLRFRCDSLCLRKLDPVSGQYRIAATFPFGGKGNTGISSYQTALWV